MSPGKQVNFRVSLQLLEKLRAASKKSGVPVSELIRRAIMKAVGMK